MKKLVFFLILPIFLVSCGGSGSGELVGESQKTKPYYQADPFGMVFVPQGSYTMGVGEQDIAYAFVHEPKTVSVSSFYA